MKYVQLLIQVSIVVLATVVSRKSFLYHDYDAAAGYVLSFYLLSLIAPLQFIKSKDVRFAQTFIVAITAIALGITAFCAIKAHGDECFVALCFFGAMVVLGSVYVVFFGFCAKRRGASAYYGLNLKKAALFIVVFGGLIVGGIVLSPALETMRVMSHVVKTISRSLQDQEPVAEQFFTQTLDKKFQSLIGAVELFLQKEEQVDMKDLIQFVNENAKSDMNIMIAFYRSASPLRWPAKILSEDMNTYYSRGFFSTIFNGHVETAPVFDSLSFFANGMPLKQNLYLFDNGSLQEIGLQKSLSFKTGEEWTFVMTTEIIPHYGISGYTCLGFQVVNKQGEMLSQKSFFIGKELDEELPSGAKIYRDIDDETYRYVVMPLNNQIFTEQADVSVSYRYTPKYIAARQMKWPVFKINLVFWLVAAALFWLLCRIDKPVTISQTVYDDAL
jgi:hypothetical protein